MCFQITLNNHLSGLILNDCNHQFWWVISSFPSYLLICSFHFVPVHRPCWLRRPTHEDYITPLTQCGQLHHFGGLKPVRRMSVTDIQLQFQRNWGQQVSQGTVGTSCGHLDIPPACFCSAVGVNVTSWNSQGTDRGWKTHSLSLVLLWKKKRRAPKGLQAGAGRPQCRLMSREGGQKRQRSNLSLFYLFVLNEKVCRQLESAVGTTIKLSSSPPKSCRAGGQVDSGRSSPCFWPKMAPLMGCSRSWIS